LWAFSEAAFGGVLHALNVPLRGIFISGAAVILISLLAFYSVKKDDIIKATITVILIKGLVSPHSPVTAYLAVFLQGALGQILFYYKRFFKTSALLLGVSAGLLSAFQKLIVLTVLFGMTLWESIDLFFIYIISQFTDNTSTSINYSYILAGLYIIIHLSGGIFFGLLAGSIPYRIDSANISLKDEISQYKEFIIKKKKRIWYKRPTGIILIFFSTIMMAVSYLSPLIGEETALNILIMLLRSIVIMFIWFAVLSPLVIKILNKIMSKKQKNSDVIKIMNLFPYFRKILSYVWQLTSTDKGITRIKNFIFYSFILLLSYEEDISAVR
jgi:hypothetical protein